jgi:translocator protein
MTSRIQQHWPSLVFFVVIVGAAAVFGAQFEQGQWYQALQKPSWNPPGAVFGPVWTTLYVCIAIAGWLVWCAARRVDAALTLWIVQLVLNAAWSWLFFGMHRPDLALVDIVLLLAAIIAFIVVAQKTSTLARWLFVPYALWVAFATALNFAIWRMNT